jgi:hypothetical protein
MLITSWFFHDDSRRSVQGKTTEGVDVMLHTARCREDICTAFLPVVEVKGMTPEEQAANLETIHEQEHSNRTVLLRAFFLQNPCTSTLFSQS